MIKEFQRLSRLFLETRELMGITQTEMGKMLDLTQAHISNIESGRKNTSGTIVFKVMDLKKRAELAKT